MKLITNAIITKFTVFFPRSRVHGFYAWVIDRHNICCLDPTKPVTKKDVGI